MNCSAQIATVGVAVQLPDQEDRVLSSCVVVPQMLWGAEVQTTRFGECFQSVSVLVIVTTHLLGDGWTYLTKMMAQAIKI